MNTVTGTRKGMRRLPLSWTASRADLSALKMTRAVPVAVPVALFFRTLMLCASPQNLRVGGNGR